MNPRGGKHGGTPAAAAQARARRPPRGSRRQGAIAAAAPAEGGAGFWGDPTERPPEAREVRISQDPSAITRSLGPPPLPGREAVSEYYFSTVYDRAVALAGALAAAGGLITPEALQDERAD